MHWRYDITELIMSSCGLYPVSIQRGDEVIIPRGDTVLQVGDLVTTLCERDTISAVKSLFLATDGSAGMENTHHEPAND